MASPGASSWTVSGTFPAPTVVHPENPALADVSFAQLSGRSRNASVSRRNAVVITTGELDWERPDTWRGVLDRSRPRANGGCSVGASRRLVGRS